MIGTIAIERLTIKRTLTGLAWLVVVSSVGSGVPALPANAQGGACTQACQSEYARCYKDSGSNRKVCESQLQQCLANCIAKR